MTDKNFFAYGTYSSDGNSYNPSYSFISDRKSGIFKTEEYVGVSSQGSFSAAFGHDEIVLLKKLKIIDNAVENSVLCGDKDGYAQWQDFPVKSGEFMINSLCKNMDISKYNNEVDIYFDKPMKTSPAISLTKECDVVNEEPKFYIKNKTNEKFTLYFDDMLTKNVTEGELGQYAFVQLSDGGVGVSYYDYAEDRIMYKYLSKGKKEFTEAIIIDDISTADVLDMVLVDNKPAIIYIGDNGDNDEWRFIKAKDANGKEWDPPVTLLTSTQSINFLPLSLNILITEDQTPVVFINNESGRAQIIVANDKLGSSWGSPINISNLSNHQIMAAKIINGYPSVVAKSIQYDTLYYVKANDKKGTSWPVGATQLYSSDGSFFIANQGECSCDLAIIKDKLSIIASEKNTNKLCISQFVENSWSKFDCIVDTNTSSPYPAIFENSGRYYVLYNDYVGIPSQKHLIEFKEEISITKNFIASLNNVKENKVIKNKNNNIFMLSSQNNLTMVNFYGNDYKINWLAK